MEVEFAPNTREVVNLPGDCHCGPGTTTQEPPPTTPPGNMRYKLEFPQLMSNKLVQFTIKIYVKQKVDHVQ